MLNFNDFKLNKKFDFKFTAIESMYPPSQFNLSSAYGGNVYKIAKVKDSPYYLVVSPKLETMDIFILPEDLDKIPKIQYNQLKRAGKIEGGEEDGV